MPLPDPATGGVTAIVATLSGLLLALLGVDYYSLMSATIAASFGMLYDNNNSSRRKAAVIMAGSSVLGAMIGTACAEHFGSLLSMIVTNPTPGPTGPSRSSVMLWSIAAATAPRPIIRALVEGAINRIKKASGTPADDNAKPPVN